MLMKVSKKITRMLVNIITKGYLCDNLVKVKTAWNKASFLGLVQTIQAIHSYTSTTETKLSVSNVTSSQGKEQ